MMHGDVGGRRAGLIDMMVGPHQGEVMDAMREAARAPVGPDLTLTDPGFDWSELPDWAVWRFEGLRPIAGSSTLIEVEGSTTPCCSGLARLVGAAAFSTATRARYDGEVVDDLAGELFDSLVESIELAREAAHDFEGLRLANGYKLEEPQGERLATFAGAQLASLVCLASSRLPGFADVLRRAERDGPESDGWPARVLDAKLGRASLPRPDLATVLPNLVLPNRVRLDADWAWYRRPDLGIDALSAAFFALRGIAPVAFRDFAPCDLAAGFAHLRQMAYASVAISAVEHGLKPDRSDPAACAELEFWIRGVERPANGPARCHGLAPLLSDDAFGIELLRLEPAGVMASIGEARAKAGLDCADIERVEAMRARQGIRSLPAFAQEFGDIAERRASDFRQARARRILAEREAAGFVIAEHEPQPTAMPDLGSPLDDEAFRVVPKEECLPKLGPHPNPRAAFQLEEPPFVTRARLARERAAAEARGVPVVEAAGGGLLKSPAGSEQ